MWKIELLSILAWAIWISLNWKYQMKLLRNNWYLKLLGQMNQEKHLSKTFIDGTFLYSSCTQWHKTGMEEPCCDNFKLKVKSSTSHHVVYSCYSIVWFSEVIRNSKSILNQIYLLIFLVKLCQLILSGNLVSNHSLKLFLKQRQLIKVKDKV